MSSQAGKKLTLFLDIINENDGLQSALHMDNVLTAASAADRPIIPAPSSLVLLAIGAASLAGYGCRWGRK